MGIKHYQEKNVRAMEKKLAQSEIPVKRKIQKTIRKYHISESYFLSTFTLDVLLLWFVGLSSALVSISPGHDRHLDPHGHDHHLLQVRLGSAAAALALPLGSCCSHREDKPTEHYSTDYNILDHREEYPTAGRRCLPAAG